MAAWQTTFCEACIIQPGLGGNYHDGTATVGDADLPDGVYTAFGVDNEGKINQYHMLSTFDKKLLKKRASELREMSDNPQAVAVLRMRTSKTQPVLKPDGSICPPPLQRMANKTRVQYGLVAENGNIGNTKYIYMTGNTGAVRFRPTPSPLPVSGKGRGKTATLRTNMALSLLEVVFDQQLVQDGSTLTQSEYDIAVSKFEIELGSNIWPLGDVLTVPGSNGEGLVVDPKLVRDCFNPHDLDEDERFWYVSQDGQKTASEAKALVVHALFEVPMKIMSGHLYSLQPLGRGVIKTQEEVAAEGASGSIGRWTNTSLIDAANAGNDVDDTCAINGLSLKKIVKYWAIKQSGDDVEDEEDNKAFIATFDEVEVPKLKPTTIAKNDVTSVPGRLFKAAQDMTKERDPSSGKVVPKESSGGGVIEVRRPQKKKGGSGAKGSVDGDAVEAMLDLVVPGYVWTKKTFKINKKIPDKQRKNKKAKKTRDSAEEAAEAFSDYEAGIHALLLQKGFSEADIPGVTELEDAGRERDEDEGCLPDEREYTPLGALLRVALEDDIRDLFQNLQLKNGDEEGNL